MNKELGYSLIGTGIGFLFSVLSNQYPLLNIALGLSLFFLGSYYILKKEKKE